MFKKEKGITLVALVVTIIVLLILAGVTISLTMSQNGIFVKSRNASKKYVNASNQEQEELTSAADTMQNTMNEYGLN